MKKIVLDIKRPWNWKIFLVLVGLIIPASFAILPFYFHIQSAYNTGVNGLGWEIILIDTLVNSAIIIFLAGLGLLITNRIGLGLPFVESWVKRETPANRFRSAAAVGWIAAVGFVLAILFLQRTVFGPPMLAMFEEIGYVVPENAVNPPVYGFLAAISAGIREEVIFRLFGLSLIAWLLRFLFHDSQGRPTTAGYWIANIIFALGFGAAHLPGANTLGWPINTLVITRTLVLNGVAGLVLGWLFWTYGLETAILAHFFADVILYALLPIIALQQSETSGILATAGVVFACLLGLIWSWRTLAAEIKGSRGQLNTAEEAV